MAEKELFLTPKARAMYPFLTKPSTKFDKDGVYKVTLLFDPKVEVEKAFLAQLRGQLTEAEKTLKNKNAAQVPWRKHLRLEDKSETGLFEVTFKSNFPPRLFDAVGNKITGELNVGNDSIVIVAYKYAPYEGFGGGIALYLQAVQIHELVEWLGGTAEDYGFTKQEDGWNVEKKFEQAADDAPPATDEEAAGQPQTDSPIPF